MLLFGSDPAFLEHDTGPGHPERPDRLRSVRQGVELAGLDGALVALPPRTATPEDLARVHTPAYLDALERFVAAGGGHLDPDTVASPASWRAALLAAGAGLAAIAAVDAGAGVPAFLAVRPPGHHALADRAMGFCLLNNVAVAAAALADRGERVAVVDWDAHHGNGTQDMFWEDDRVLYVSFHQSPLYPGSGLLDETGGGPGEGTTLNLPFPPGATGDVYQAAVDAVVGPLAARFEPDWVLVSCGYDAHRADPLTQLSLTSGDYADLTARVVEMAPRRDRVLVFLEGGYDLEAIRDSAAATLTALVEGASPVRPERASAGGPGREVVEEARRRWLSA